METVSLPDYYVEGCRSSFVYNQCMKCHDIDGQGQTDKNLTPVGLQYLEQGRGCIGNMTVIKSQILEEPPEHISRERIELARHDFEENNCIRCHSVEGGGETRGNFTPYGLAMYQANSGCIACLHAVVKKLKFQRPRYTTE